MAERPARARASAPLGGLTGPGSPAVSLALLLATAAALSSFSVLLEDEMPWFGQTLVTAAAVLGVGLLVRRTAPAWARLWSVFAALVALVVALVVLFANDAVLPVGDELPFEGLVRRFGTLILDGETGIAEQGIPAIAEDGIRFLLAAGIGFLALLADIAASALRRPALAVVPLLVVLAVPVVLVPGQLPLPSALATAVAYLLLLAVHRPAASGGGAGAGRAIGIAGAVVALAVVVPSLLPAVVVGDRPGGTVVRAVTTGVNPVISLGDDLRRGAPVTVLRYSTTADGGVYLTLSHLADFEGQEVQPVVRDADPEATDQVGPPPWLGDDVPSSEAVTDIALANMRSRWVPLPSAPEIVTDLDGSWVVDRDGVTMRAPAGTLREGAYSVSSRVAEPTPEQLRAAGIAAGGVERYRAVPDDIEPIVGQTAREVVGDLGAPYEQALALQRFFTGGDFEYSEDAPVDGGYDGTGADIVARFLEERSGYCVHYASAMTLMARTLGIPARIAVGFLPGTRNPDAPSEFVVSSDDLHAWPELHFDGIGWVRFEPTPSRGTTPAYAADDVPTGLAAEPGVTPSPAPSASGPADAPSAAPPTAGPDGADPLVPGDTGGTNADGTDGAEAGAGAGFRLDPRVVVAVLVALLLAALAAPGVWRAVRGARRRASSDVLDRWREVRDSARDLGLPAELTRTPRELAAGWGVVDLAARAELAILLAATEARAFADPHGAAPTAPPIAGILTALRARARWWHRVVARVAPRSLLTRGDDALLEPTPA